MRARPRSTPFSLLPLSGKGGKSPKLTFMGWKLRGPSSEASRQMTARDVREESAERGRRRGRQCVASKMLGGGEASREQTDRR